MKKIFLIILLIFLACCTSHKPPANNGLVISDFFIDPDEMYSQRPFKVYMEIENVGGTTASEIKTKLYGVSWDSRELEQDAGILLPPNPKTGAPGGTGIKFWSLTSPMLPEGVTHTYTITGRATYAYSTSSAVNIPVMNEQEYRRSKSSEAMTISNTDGPIKVEVQGTSPVIVKAEGGVERVFYKIYFNNIGSGVPITQGTTGLIKGTIELYGEGASFGNCLSTAPHNKLTLPDAGNNMILIRKGESALVPCEIQIERARWQAKPKDTITLVFDLVYDYYVDMDADVRVIGTK